MLLQAIVFGVLVVVILGDRVAILGVRSGELLFETSSYSTTCPSLRLLSPASQGATSAFFRPKADLEQGRRIGTQMGVEAIGGLARRTR